MAEQLEKWRAERSAVAGGLESAAQAGRLPAAIDRFLATSLSTWLVSLGVASPVAAAVTWLLVQFVRRRRRKRSRQRTSRPRVSLHDDYARQLAEVHQYSGRSSVQDATLGREYEEELRRHEESSDPQIRAWARSLRDKVTSRFLRIHGESPSPAEPIASSAR